MGDRTPTPLDPRSVQRRVALLLLPLRIFLGVAWLRAGLSKVLEPGWLDGSALTGVVQGQVAEGAAPFAFYADALVDATARIATPMGVAVTLGEIAIGLGLLTGTMTSLALVMAIVLNVNFVLAGAASPSQYYIVMQLVLLVGCAGSDFSLDRWVTRDPRTRAGAARSGVFADARAPRRGLLVGAVVATVLAVAAAALGPLRLSSLLPSEGVDDATYAIVALLGTAALMAVALLSVRRARHGGSHTAQRSDGTRDPEGSAAWSPARGPRERPHEPERVPRRAPSRPPPAADEVPPRQRAPSIAPFGRRERAEVPPTTQFPRPVRGRDFGDRTDPYAELRDLLPIGARTSAARIRDGRDDA